MADEGKKPSFDRSLELTERLHRLIPGGAHTYAKGDDQYPELSPAFIARGKGCHVWDLDGNEYIEYGMGLRAVTLGHAYEPVVQAVPSDRGDLHDLKPETTLHLAHDSPLEASSKPRTRRSPTIAIPCSGHSRAWRTACRR